MDKRSLGNKGFTVVELLIAIGIAASITTFIGTMLTGSLLTFRQENIAVNLQAEAQLTMNQISDYIMEAKAITDYESNNYIELLKTRGLQAIDNVYIRFYFIEEEQKLYYQERIGSTYTTPLEFANYIVRFLVNADEAFIDLEIGFVHGDIEIEMNSKVKVRNR